MTVEGILNDRTIIVGTAAHGAVLYTATAAATRNLQVVIPLDGISGDIPYVEPQPVSNSPFPWS